MSEPFAMASSVPVITVGVDGSASSVTALRFAAAEADLCGGMLRAVGAYSYDDSGREAQRAVEKIERALRDARDYGGRWRDVQVVVEGGAVPAVLHRASADSVMLVVGAGRHSRMVRLLAGSVLPALTYHVNVPTVVVPTGWTGSVPR